MADKMLLRRIATALESHAYRFANESQLHDAMAAVLEGIGVSCQREHVAGPRDRFDFLCDGGIVIEVKVKGSLPEAMRQVERYCALDAVQAVILVSTRQWAGGRLRSDLAFHGKPVQMVKVSSQAF